MRKQGHSEVPSRMVLSYVCNWSRLNARIKYIENKTSDTSGCLGVKKPAQALRDQVLGGVSCSVPNILLSTPVFKNTVILLIVLQSGFQMRLLTTDSTNLALTV